MKKIKVVIAEDFQCYVEGYLAVLNLIPNVQVTNIFKDGQELIDYSRKNKSKIDFILLDVRMPNFDGVDVLKYFKENNLNFNIIMVSEHYDESFYELCKKKLGLNGFISKCYFSDFHFQEAMNFINNGETYFVNRFEPMKYEDSYLVERKNDIILSEREKEFIPLLEEYSFNQIAERKGVSLSTVKTTIARAKEKYNVNNNIGLIKLFFNVKL